jgi:endoglucanase
VHSSGTKSKLLTDHKFVNLWFNLAEFYAQDDRVIFGLLDQAPDVDTATWAATVQAAVNSIRDAGASQSIVIPGGFVSSGAWVDGSNAAILVSPTLRSMGQF